MSYDLKTVRPGELTTAKTLSSTAMLQELSRRGVIAYAKHEINCTKADLEETPALRELVQDDLRREMHMHVLPGFTKLQGMVKIEEEKPRGAVVRFTASVMVVDVGKVDP